MDIINIWIGEKPMKFKHLKPVPFHHVKITDGIWHQCINTVRKTTVLDCIKKSEHAINNFKKAAGVLPGGFEGVFFDDADVYKIIEGMAYVLMDSGDVELEKQADELIDIVCAAQQPDGYIFNFFVLSEINNRWTDMDHHEAFCVSQLLEAGIAYYQATNKDKLLNAALKAVDQMMETLLADPRGWISGHEGIEMALVRLYRLNDEEKYLEYAQWFVEQRGHVKLRLPISWEKEFFTDEYCQNDVPARELKKVTGHAVRAMYYYSALADIASIKEDIELETALCRLWDNVNPPNLYITGGIGQSSYNEGFTKDWSLPNLTAYCETCASIGMAFWNRRMTFNHGEARYGDLVERELYNGILAGISLEGNKYFYENPLSSVGVHHRRDWFNVPCCPTNLVRFLPAVGGNMYATSENKIYIDQYIPSISNVPLENGEAKLQIETNYPWEGEITITVVQAPENTSLYLRKPNWCKKWKIVVDKEENEIALEQGYLPIDVTEGSKILLSLDMPVERVYADKRVLENTGRVAIMRGPLVYCAEEMDNPGIPTEYFHAEFSLPKNLELTPKFEKEMLNGVTTLVGENVRLIPYYSWDNRDSGGMVVWMKEK